jgi:aminopeptidase N
LAGIKDQVGKTLLQQLLAAALKDPFFRIRIQALELWILAILNK